MEDGWSPFVQLYIPSTVQHPYYAQLQPLGSDFMLLSDGGLKHPKIFKM